MSVASSAASTRSVNYAGEEMTVDSMLETIVREVQNALNSLQIQLRQLCALDDQQVDEDQDFREAVELEDAAVDLADVICIMMKDLVPVVADIRGKPPTKESKAWWVTHKAAVKALRKIEADARKNAIALAKAAAAEGLPGVPE